MYHVLEVQPAGFNIGGTEQFIIKNIHYLDKSRFSTGFLCCGMIYDQKGFEIFQKSFDTAEALNIDYGILKPWKILIYLRKYLKSHPCDIIHIHNGFVSNMTVCALAAKLAGVRHVICHLHGTDLSEASSPLKSFIKSLRKKIDLQILSLCTTDFFTCSQKAAELTLGNHFMERIPVEFFPNAIDVSSFLYNPAEREKIRSQYHLKNHFLVGTVGRLSHEKNQMFLLDIFYEIAQKNDNAMLMLVGEGPCRQEIEDRICQLHLKDKVILTGSVSNVNAYLQAFDVFALPSLTEAFPIVMVEAQAAGLPTFVSDVITRETAITDLVHFMSLKEPASAWCDAILSCQAPFYSGKRSAEFSSDIFDLNRSGKNLENHYLSLVDHEKF